MSLTLYFDCIRFATALQQLDQGRTGHIGVSEVSDLP